MTPSHDSNPDARTAEPKQIPKAENKPPSDWGPSRRRVRRFLAAVTILYIAALVGLLCLMDWKGEQLWILTPLLYLPPHVFLAPLVALVPVCLVLDRKLCVLHAAAAAWVLFGYMDFRWPSRHPAASPPIKIVTNNLGQRKAHTLLEFIEQEQPDIIALQDARASSANHLLKDQPTLFKAVEGEFFLASKFPIKKSGLVDGEFYGRNPVAARFELEYQGHAIAIYTVHMPTPRPELLRLRGRGFLAEWEGGKGIYSAGVRESYAAYWEQRIELAQHLVEIFKTEQLPFLVVGDFNTPAHGYICNLFNSQLTDCFTECGSGYGTTFPGDSKHPFAFTGPWLRLDYIFAGKGWRPVECRVEALQPAQHLAVSATLELLETH